MESKRKEKRTGFTIVELLTVMGIIAILIGLLVPALTLVRDYAKEIQQRAQFHSIEVGAELFKTEFGSYPESNDNLDASTLRPDHLYDPTPYGGANKLAEAMVGQDMIGFHPNSDFRSDGDYARDDGAGGLEHVPVYHPIIDDLGNAVIPPETAEENVAARKGPFLDLENANAFEMQDVYEIANLGSFDIDTLVLCDVYTAKRQSAKKAGMPILYYRAHKEWTQQDSTDLGTIINDIYYYPDNQNLLELGLPEDTTAHPLSDGTPAENWLDFDNMIRNIQVTQVRRPYKADSYILVSAGKDGVYGSPDDIFNFKKN